MNEWGKQEQELLEGKKLPSLNPAALLAALGLALLVLALMLARFT